VAQKLTEVAHLALDKMMDMLPMQTDPVEIRESAQMALDRIGYAPRGAGQLGGIVNQQNNFYAVDANTLSQARARIMQRQGLIIDESLDPATSDELSAGGDRSVGGPLLHGPSFPPSDEAERAESGGDSV
jgi:hypothetical protein